MTRLDDEAMRRLLDLGREMLPDLDLGKYQLVREIGRGGMGVVYEARDMQLGRRVALKLLAVHAGFSATLRQRFVREATAAGRLQHPHIAQVYDATPDFIAMQFVRGPNLLECGASVEGYLRLVRDAARAVQHAHDHGVVHRDLKPSNLLVDGAHVYVMDFGLAKEGAVASSLSLSGNVIGTPSYMAPEQAQGRVRDVDERSDVYGLGATLWACLAGRAPFDGEEVVEVLRRVVETEPARLAHLDRDLDTVVRKAMAKERGRRYPTADALADDLDRWLERRPIEARRPSLIYRVTRFARRHRTGVRVGAAAIFVLAIAVLFALAERTRSGALSAGLTLSNSVGHLLADAEDHFRASDGEMRRRQLEEAARLCQVFLAEHAAVAQAHYLYGRVLRQLGEFKRALASLDRALVLESDLREARFERGLLLVERFDEAAAAERGAVAIGLAHFREQAHKDLAASLDDELALRHADELYGRARLCLLEGDDEKAKHVLEHILGFDPSYAAALELLVNPVYRLEEDADRQRLLQATLLDMHRGFHPHAGRALTVGADQPLTPRGVLVDLPTSSSALPRDVLKHAHRGLRRLLQAEAMRSQGLAADAMMQAREALSDLSYAITVTGDDAFAAAFHNRAVLRMRMACDLDSQDRVRAFGERELAIADLDRAIRDEPKFAFAYLNRGIARMAQALQQQRGGLGGLAASAFACAADDAARALALLPQDWAQRLALAGLRDECVAAANGEK